MNPLISDIYYVLRLLRKSPIFACAAIMTLALGIGANVAVFTLIDRVVLHPLALPHANRLVIVQERSASSPVPRDGFLYDEYLRSRRATSTLSGVAGVAAFHAVAAAYGDQTVQAPVLFVSANYFDVLGLAPGLGRTFQPVDDTASAEPVAILSERAWRTRFGADPGCVGRSVRMNGLPVAVVGVAPTGFIGTLLGADPPEIFLPLESARRFLTVGNFFSSVVANGFSPQNWIMIVGRLRDGVTVAQASAEIAGLFPARRGGSPRSVAPLEDTVLPVRSRDDVVRFTTLLAGTVALTLLIGCANLTGLMLARVEERRTELAVRAALGAGRWRLASLLFVEAAVIASLGGAAALVVAMWAESLLAPFELPGGIAVSVLRNAVDHRALLVTALLTILAALLCGLSPALGAAHRDPMVDLKRQSGGAPKLRAARVLVGLQVAVCLVLVFGAGLFVRSLSAALATDVGFDTRDLVVASVSPRFAPGYDEAHALNYVGAFFDRARRIPGVQMASIGPVPLTGHGGFTPMVRVDGVPTPLTKTWPPPPTSVDSNDVMFIDYVGADYFSTLHLPLATGRDFTAADDTRPVAIVSESLGRRLWGGQNPLGRRIGFLPLKVDLEIVGIVRDVKQVNLRDPGRLSVYVPRGQASPFERGSATVILRVPGARESAIRELYRTVAALNPNMPLSSRNVTTVEARINVLLMPQRLGRALLGWLGLMAIALTIVGVYSLVVCVVARSTREIGVRVALGAEASDILRGMMARAIAPIAIGVVAGSAAAWWAGRFADRFMYGIRGSDPTTLAVVAVALVLVGVGAALVPARRALRMDPIEALRAE